MFGPSSYRQFFNEEIEGASESNIEKLSSRTRTKKNQPISNQIAMVRVHLNQISHHIKHHAIWAKNCFLVDMNSDHFRVHLYVYLYFEKIKLTFLFLFITADMWK